MAVGSGSTPWYTPEWAERMQATHGIKPTVTYYESLVVVDDETGEVREEKP